MLARMPLAMVVYVRISEVMLAISCKLELNMKRMAQEADVCPLCKVHVCDRLELHIMQRVHARLARGKTCNSTRASELERISRSAAK